MHQLPTDEVFARMFAAATAARANAYAPYSRYLVGAAVLTADGNVFAGANVENAAYPQGWCAETSALGAMVTAGERSVVAVLTICGSADDTTGPGPSEAPLPAELVGTCCGGCRQKLREFAALDTPVMACEPSGLRATYSLAELLPASFGPEHLAR